MQITAAVARTGQHDFSLETLTIEAPRAEEVLVRIIGVGLCHTDIKVRESDGGWFPFPAVLGHEGSGIVEAVGADVTDIAPGDHVVLSFLTCGQCRPCTAGQPPHCTSMIPLNFGGKRPDGTSALSDANGPVSAHFFGQSSFASHALAHRRNVVKVSKDLPLELLGPLGCGIQTGAGAIIHSFGAKPGDSLLVMGAGAVGLSAVMAANIIGCTPIIVLEPHESRRALAKDFGAHHVLDPASAPDIAAAVQALVPGGMNYVLDTTGLPDLAAAGIAALAPHGTLGVLASSAANASLTLSLNALVSKGHHIIGIVEGDADPHIFIPEMINHYLEGRLPFDKMIKTYPLADINQAIADSEAGLVTKAVLIP